MSVQINGSDIDELIDELTTAKSLLQTSADLFASTK